MTPLRPRRAVPTLLLALAPLPACASTAPPPAHRPAVLGEVEDALGGEGPVAELTGGLPATFLVGDGAWLDELLAERARLAKLDPGSRLFTLIDLRDLDPLASVDAADRALEAALDPGGPVLLDRSGTTCASLRAGASGVLLVRLGARGEVLAELDCGEAGDGARTAFLRGDP